MANILVTGANGYLGSEVCRKAVEKGHHVKGLVLKGTSLARLKDLDLKLY